MDLVSNKLIFLTKEFTMIKNAFFNNNIEIKTTTTTVIKCESNNSPCQRVKPV